MAKDSQTQPPPPSSYSSLHRSTTNKIIAGVAGGLGEYLNIDPTIIRILFILISIFGGSGILIYLILWLIMPSGINVSNNSHEHIRKNADEIAIRARNFAHDIRISPKHEESRFWWGLILVIIGFLILFNNFGIFEIFNFGKLWPILLVIFGVMILTRKK